MRIGLMLGLLISAIVLMVMAPWTSMAMGPPGGLSGSVNEEDPYWLGDWCGIMLQDDKDEESWTTGVTLCEVYYSTGQGDQSGFNNYIREMTIPWIGIQMTGGDMIHYGFSEETTAYYFCITDYEVFNYDDDGYSGATIWYGLDFDGNSINEWEIMIKLELNPPKGQNPGYIKMEMAFTDHPVIQNPPVWGYNGTTVQTIEIPFRIDGDV